MVIDIYTDGSYNRQEPSIVHGGAYIIFKDEDKEYMSKIHFINKDRILTSMNNVGGEILAVIASLRLVEEIINNKENNFVVERIKIFHDYKGVAHWTKGEWATNKQGTVLYVQRFNEIQSRLNIPIEFEYVKGHSNNYGNTIADLVSSFDMGYVRDNGITIYETSL